MFLPSSGPRSDASPGVYTKREQTQEHDRIRKAERCKQAQRPTSQATDRGTVGADQDLVATYSTAGSTICLHSCVRRCLHHCPHRRLEVCAKLKSSQCCFLSSLLSVCFGLQVDDGMQSESRRTYANECNEKIEKAAFWLLKVGKEVS